MITDEIHCPSCNVIIATVDEMGRQLPRYGVRHRKGCKYNKENNPKTPLFDHWLKNL